MASRKAKNPPMTKDEMIEAGQKRRATSRIYRAEADEIKDEAITKSIENAIKEIRQADKRKRVSLDDANMVKALAGAYLETCALSSSFPSMSSLALCLGYTRQNLYHYMEKNPDTETGQFLHQLHDLFSNILAENSLRNNANSIVSIFLLKSLFGFKDTQTYEIVQGMPLQEPSADDIIARAELLE